MLKKLFYKKENIISYIISILVSFATIAGDYPAFMISFFSAIIDLKIPALIPFLLMSIICFCIFDLTISLKFILVVLIYVILKSFLYKKEKKIEVFDNIVKLVISIAIVNTSFLIADAFSFDNFANIVFSDLISIAFYIIFLHGLPQIFKITEKTAISSEEQLAMISLILICFSAFSNIYIFDLSIISIIIVSLIMLSSWKKRPIFAFLFAISIIICAGLISRISIKVFILLLLCAFISSFLSKASKKGAILGLVFSILVCFSSSNNSIIYKNNREEETINARLENDINHYFDIKNGEDNEKKISPADIILREMAIGFFIILCIPEEVYKQYNKRFKSKMSFSDAKIKFLPEKNIKKKNENIKI